MIEQIVIRNENNVRLGIVFPRRAKQLVSKKKARWLDEAHTEIILLSSETGGIKMDMKIDNHVNELFGDISESSAIHDLKEKKSIVKDAYRDSPSVVLRSSPVEIIKKSKRRTRELHAAFSAVLWVGAALLYFGLSFLFGFTHWTWKVYELTWTWLVFAFAALIECGAEIYFCRKELGVLNENIDLRQVNPANGGDFDLRSYQKKLTSKIRMMSSAALWIPLVIVYFACGYAFNLWGVAWIVFVFAVFFELVMNFIRKLKKGVD